MGGLNGLKRMTTASGGLRVCGALALGLLMAFTAAGQELIASADGKLKIPAHWFKVSSPDLRPVAIALHGCSGALDAKGRLNPIWQRYAGYFNAERIHFVVLDSFSPRGEKSICATPNRNRSIHEADRRGDVFAAIAWLSAQPGIDPARILVMGWSHGAQTAMSVNDASDGVVQVQKVRPKAVAAFYPGCLNLTKNPGYAIAAPLLLMIGELDDWTSASHCATLRDAVVARQGRADQKVAFDLVVYPGSYHGFDGLTPVRTMQNIGNTKSGTATVGENPAARKAAHARLFEFVSQQFGEPLRLTHEDRLKTAPSPLPMPDASAVSLN